MMASSIVRASHASLCPAPKRTCYSRLHDSSIAVPSSNTSTTTPSDVESSDEDGAGVSNSSLLSPSLSTSSSFSSLAGRDSAVGSGLGTAAEKKGPGVEEKVIALSQLEELEEAIKERQDTKVDGRRTRWIEYREQKLKVSPHDSVQQVNAQIVKPEVKTFGRGGKAHKIIRKFLKTKGHLQKLPACPVLIEDKEDTKENLKRTLITNNNTINNNNNKSSKTMKAEMNGAVLSPLATNKVQTIETMKLQFLQGTDNILGGLEDVKLKSRARAARKIKLDRHNDGPVADRNENVKKRQLRGRPLRKENPENISSINSADPTLQNGKMSSDDTSDPNDIKIDIKNEYWRDMRYRSPLTTDLRGIRKSESGSESNPSSPVKEENGILNCSSPMNLALSPISPIGPAPQESDDDKLSKIPPINSEKSPRKRLYRGKSKKENIDLVSSVNGLDQSDLSKLSLNSIVAEDIVVKDDMLSTRRGRVRSSRISNGKPSLRDNPEVINVKKVATVVADVHNTMNGEPQATIITNGLPQSRRRNSPTKAAKKSPIKDISNLREKEQNNPEIISKVSDILSNQRSQTTSTEKLSNSTKSASNVKTNETSNNSKLSVESEKPETLGDTTSLSENKSNKTSDTISLDKNSEICETANIINNSKDLHVEKHRVKPRTPIFSRSNAEKRQRSILQYTKKMNSKYMFSNNETKDYLLNGMENNAGRSAELSERSNTLLEDRISAEPIRTESSGFNAKLKNSLEYSFEETNDILLSPKGNTNIRSKSPECSIPSRRYDHSIDKPLLNKPIRSRCSTPTLNNKPKDDPLLEDIDKNKVEDKNSDKQNLSKEKTNNNEAEVSDKHLNDKTSPSSNMLQVSTNSEEILKVNESVKDGKKSPVEVNKSNTKGSLFRVMNSQSKKASNLLNDQNTAERERDSNTVLNNSKESSRNESKLKDKSQSPVESKDAKELPKATLANNIEKEALPIAKPKDKVPRILKQLFLDEGVQNILRSMNEESDVANEGLVTSDTTHKLRPKRNNENMAESPEPEDFPPISKKKKKVSEVDNLFKDEGTLNLLTTMDNYGSRRHGGVLEDGRTDAIGKLAKSVLPVRLSEPPADNAAGDHRKRKLSGDKTQNIPSSNVDISESKRLKVSPKPSQQISPTALTSANSVAISKLGAERPPITNAVNQNKKALYIHLRKQLEKIGIKTANMTLLQLKQLVAKHIKRKEKSPTAEQTVPPLKIRIPHEKSPTDNSFNSSHLSGSNSGLPHVLPADNDIAIVGEAHKANLNTPVTHTHITSFVTKLASPKVLYSEKVSPRPLPEKPKLSVQIPSSDVQQTRSVVPVSPHQVLTSLTSQVDSNTQKSRLKIAEGVRQSQRASVRQNDNSHFREIALRKYNNFVQILLIPSTTKMKNALNSRVLRELCDALSILKRDDNVNVVLLTATGSTFCQGIDLTLLLHPNLETRKKNAENLSRGIKEFLRALVQFPKVIIAGVNGSAMGLGVTMLPLFDQVIAIDSAEFYLPYAKLGQVPEGGFTYTFPTYYGKLQSNKLFMGQKITATEACNIGMVSETLWASTYQQELLPKVAVRAAQSRQSMEATKALMNHHLVTRLELSIESECRLLVQHWMTQTFSHLCKKFIESTHLPQQKPLNLPS